MYTKKLPFNTENQLLLYDVAYDKCPLRCGRQHSKKAHFWHIVTRSAMCIGRMADRRLGSECRHDFAVILYTSLGSVINR